MVCCSVKRRASHNVWQIIPLKTLRKVPKHKPVEEGWFELAEEKCARLPDTSCCVSISLSSLVINIYEKILPSIQIKRVRCDVHSTNNNCPQAFKTQHINTNIDSNSTPNSKNNGNCKLVRAKAKNYRRPISSKKKKLFCLSHSFILCIKIFKALNVFISRIFQIWGPLTVKDDWPNVVLHFYAAEF